MFNEKGALAYEGARGPFEQGMLSALACLKIAIQASPDFNKKALEDAVEYFIAARPAHQAKMLYDLPLEVIGNSYGNVVHAINAGKK